MKRFHAPAFRFGTAAIVGATGLATLAIAPALAASPFGTWWTGDKKGQIKIVNCGGALCGNLVWLKEPDKDGKPRTDENNSDPNKRSRPLLGIPIVLDMKPAGADKWEGHVYNSRDGNTYSGSFTMTGTDTADLKGCVMGGLLCKTEEWTRAK